MAKTRHSTLDPRDRLLADLLRHLGDAPVEELHRVRSLRPIGGPLRDERREAGQQVAARIFARCLRRRAVPASHHPRETGARPGVTRRPLLLDPIQDGVAVAVQPDLADPLDVTGCLAFAPEGAAGTAEVVGVAGIRGAGERVAVGEGHHEDVAGPVLLRDHGHQPVGPEPHRRQPTFTGHGEKLPASRTIVKKPCRA
jgi:hypothetical protein